jgi:hypothetical protein
LFDEQRLLGTGDAVKRAAGKPGDSIFVLYGTVAFAEQLRRKRALESENLRC